MAFAALAFAGRLVPPWWTHSDAVLVPAFALMIFGGASATDRATVLASATMVLLGEASYAMYILHVPVRFWWELLMPATGGGLPPWLYVVLYFLVVVGVSVLVFRCVGTPMRRWIAGKRGG